MAKRATVPAAHGQPLDTTEFVVVDVETTGGSAVYDRVIEVAAAHIRDGQVEAQWSTLVNPGLPVPPFITGLTGITTAMVIDAPRFADVADRLAEFVGERPFVAHNVAFDANFLRQEYARLGRTFEPERVCTLRLSRRLLSTLHSHSLDSLIHYLGLSGRQHRALSDVVNTAQILRHLLELAARREISTLGDLLTLQRGEVKRRPAAAQFDREMLSGLPSGPGVYLLKDAEGHIFYVGKSTNVRRRVREHLAGKYEGQTRLRKLVKRIGEVQVYPTGSELEALLLEAKLIKQYLPAANQLMRNWEHYPFIKVTVQERWPRILPTRSLADDGALYFGPFRRAGTVASVVGFLRERFGLRECNRDRFPDGATCPLEAFGTCLAPCTGQVDQAGYRAAVDDLVRLLAGDGEGLIEAMEAHMHTLAESLRFEAAAELRDHLSELRGLIGTQQRLTEVSRNHAVIVAPGDSTAERRLFCIRAGRLARQEPVPLTATLSELAALLAAAFAGDDPGQITKEAVDDMWIIAAWLRHHRDEPGYHVLDIDLSAYTEVAQPLADLLANLRAEAEATPPARTRARATRPRQAPTRTESAAATT